MDRNGAMEDDRWALKRIVALLFAFAGLAERLCDLPGPTRGLVFWILRCAETIARDLVLDMALEQGVAASPALCLIPALHVGDTLAEATQLAESFRALAVLLDRLGDENPGRRQRGLGRLCIKLAACAAGLATGMQFGQGQPSLTPHACAVGPRDTS